MTKKQIIGRIVAYSMVAIGGYFGLNQIEKYRTSPTVPTISVAGGELSSVEPLSVIVPDMHEFTLHPGGDVVTIYTNGRPFSYDGDHGRWLVQIQNRKGVNMSPSERINGWDIDCPGNNISLPSASDVRSISFRLPKRDGLLLTLPVKIVVWYKD